jgi:hypothetical protein
VISADRLDVAGAFDGLRVPKPKQGGLVFSVARLSGLGSTRVGKTSDGDPAILFPATESGVPRPPIELRHIAVMFAVRCQVVGDNEEQAHFTVVRCRGDGPIRAYFLLLAGTMLSAIGPHATDDRVEDAVRTFVELFRAAARPSMRTLRGLWGELLLIAKSADPEMMLRAWHLAADERFDFGQGTQRVEVKTCPRSSREHHFSLDQLTADTVNVCVVSIQVEPSVGGVSLFDLVEEINARLADADAAMRLLSTVGLILAGDWAEYASAKFDDGLAVSSVRYFATTTIPCVSLPLPPGVSRVEFVADLASCQVMPAAKLRDAGGLWTAAQFGQ